ncbi:MAG: 3-oxoacid CoA-transferase subunit A [Gammaproteobacteria bacterium]|nr:3-oxoacid CoA-transferase subunit A [Gammaproteobacteria bacterium]
MNKTVNSLSEAVASVADRTTLMIGGFGGSGAPIELMHSLIDRFTRTGHPNNLTVINNNSGNGQVGLAAMIREGMVTKLICSYPRSADPSVFAKTYASGDIELELVPQGTLAERIRAGGAGIPAFYTPAGFGTDLAREKPTQIFDGQSYVQERWLKADVALIKAEVADSMGNLTYRKTARNFNPLMAMAAATTIVQVSKLVNPGEINPEHVITPGIFVTHLVSVSQPRQEEELMRAKASYP